MINFEYKRPTKDMSCVRCDYLVVTKNFAGVKQYFCADALWEDRKLKTIKNIPQKTGDCLDFIIKQKKKGTFADFKIRNGFLSMPESIPEYDSCGYTNGCLSGYCDFWTVIGRNTDACALFLKKTKLKKLKECREMLLENVGEEEAE